MGSPDASLRRRLARISSLMLTRMKMRLLQLAQRFWFLHLSCPNIIISQRAGELNVTTIR